MKAYKIINTDIIAEYDIKRGDSDSFWEDHWKDGIEKTLRKSSNGYLGGMKFLTKYCNSDSIILEGGCGKAQYVKAFSAHKFNILGLDFAIETLKIAKNVFSELKITGGDLRQLPFKDNSFTNYISIGVIEHFDNNGHQSQILDEAKRVTNGILFFSVPYLSPALLKKISQSDLLDIKGKNFYQYYYSKEEFLKLLRRNNLTPIKHVFYSSILGLKRNNKIFSQVYKHSKIFRKFVHLNYSLIDVFTGRKYAHMIGVWCKVE